MIRIRFLTLVLGLLTLFVPGAMAQAAAPMTFVASTGSDSNQATDCQRSAPCLSFNAAHNVTDVGGIITCLDSGPFSGSLQVTSTSITIDCAGGTYIPDNNQIGVQVASSFAVVTIRNMVFSGTGGGGVGSGSRALECDSCKALIVENCVIEGFNTGVAIAIRFITSNAGAQLIVKDTVITNNGILNTGAGGGIQVAPASAGSAGVVLNRVQLGMNVTGMIFNSSNGAITAIMRDSVVSSSLNNGILSLAGQTNTFTIERSSLLVNVGNAIQASGGNSIVRIGDSTIVGNAVGVSAVSGGTVQSFKENHIAGNGSDGTPLTAFPGPGGTPLQ